MLASSGLLFWLLVLYILFGALVWALTAGLRRLWKHPWVLCSSLVCSLLLAGVTVFRLSIDEALTFFLGPLVRFHVYVLFLGVLVWSSVVGLRGLRRRQLAPMLPFAIAIFTLAAVLLLPIEQWLLDCDFQAGLSDREDLVRAIESGQLQENGLIVVWRSPAGADRYLARLPAGYSHLSRGGGEIGVERDNRGLTVLFWTERGFFGGVSSGFLFSSTDLVVGDRFQNNRIYRVRRLRDHWYWAVFW